MIEAFKLSCPYRVNKALDTELVNKITQQNYKTFNTLAKYAFAGENGRNARKNLIKKLSPKQQDSFINEAVTKPNIEAITAFKFFSPDRVNKALDNELLNKIEKKDYQDFNTLAWCRLFIKGTRKDKPIHSAEVNKALDDALIAAINQEDSQDIMAMVKRGAYPHVITEKNRTALMIINPDDPDYTPLLDRIYKLHERKINYEAVCTAVIAGVTTAIGPIVGAVILGVNGYGRSKYFSRIIRHCLSVRCIGIDIRGCLLGLLFYNS